MKKLIALALHCLSLLLVPGGCQTDTPGCCDSSLAITLTRDGFADYFLVEFNAMNVRMNGNKALCDVDVQIQSLTNREIGDVTVKLKITINYQDDIYFERGDNIMEREVTIPADGDTHFILNISSPPMSTRVFSKPIAPDFEYWTYEITEISGKLR